MAGKVFRELSAKYDALPWYKKFLRRLPLRIKAYKLLYFNKWCKQ